MLLAPLLLLLSAAPPAPCSPNETTVVCHCKQGAASACEALRQVDPQRAAELERAAAQSKPAPAKAPETPPRASAQASAAGQQHHAISKRIADELSRHPTLQGKYTPRDPRLVTQAKDLPAHHGYQEWHRKVDEEVIGWLKRHPKATTEQFETFLRELYSRPDLAPRFPNGL